MDEDEDRETSNYPSADPWMHRHPWAEPLIVVLFLSVILAAILVLD